MPLPVHQPPETQAPSEPETAIPPSLYLIAEHKGIIGLFDASGELLRSVNVFVMTLPEAEREALAVGIPAIGYKLDGTEYIIVKQSDILAVVE